MIDFLDFWQKSGKNRVIQEALVDLLEITKIKAYLSFSDIYRADRAYKCDLCGSDIPEDELFVQCSPSSLRKIRYRQLLTKYNPSSTREEQYNIHLICAHKARYDKLVDKCVNLEDLPSYGKYDKEIEMVLRDE